MTNSDQGKAFLDGVISKLPPDQQAKAREAFADAQAAAALEEAGRGYRSLSETSRLADELRQQTSTAQQFYDQNLAWYNANKAEVEEASRLRARVAELEGKPAPVAPPAPAGPDLKNYVTKDDMGALAADALGMFALTPTLAVKHYRVFGTEPDMGAVIRKAQTEKITVDKAYDLHYAAELKAKADEAEAARVQQIKDEAVREFRQANPRMPYLNPRESGGSPLDGLRDRKPDAPPTDLVADSIAMYDELVASKGARA